MKHLKMLGVLAVAAMALAAFFGAGSASASVLTQTVTPSGSVTVPINTVIEATLKSGSTATLRDTNKATVDTCTGSEVKGKVENNGGGGTGSASGAISALTFTGCSHKTTVLKNGSLSVASGSKAVSSIGAEVTVESTIFGASCIAKTGAGTVIGTVTNATGPHSNATIDINGVIPMGLCGDAVWTGEYEVTSPVGLIVD